MSDALLLPIYPARIAKGQVLHDLRERFLADLNRQVHVVAHQTEAMDAVPVARDTLVAGEDRNDDDHRRQ